MEHRPDRLQVVAVLRLLVSDRGRLLYGEAIDAETEVGRRFKGWAGLDAAVRLVISNVVEAARGDARPASATLDQEQPPGAPRRTRSGPRSKTAG